MGGARRNVLAARARRLAWRAAAIAALPCALLSGCRSEYKPGLGELMNFTQIRHAKLWLAGRAQNWDLARYELDELQEGFDDVVRFHPTHEGVPTPLSTLVPAITTRPIGDLRGAIAAHDEQAFVAAYDALTNGCNACHQAARFGFNVVTRPTGPSWFGNQDFGGER